MSANHLALPRNPHGRDIVIGDIHGHFSRVARQLERIGFDPAADRLICVGDLVDRGPESGMAAAWLSEPWFFSVMGNHDAALLCRAGLLQDSFELFFANHAWFDQLPHSQQAYLLEMLAQLPWALTIDTDAGPVGVVHAEVPVRYADWQGFVAALDQSEVRQLAIANRHQARDSHPVDDTRADMHPPLAGVSHVIHGHTPIKDGHPKRLANRFWIDTMGWHEHGEHPFCLVDARDPGTPL